MENTISTVTYTIAFLVGLEVNIRSASPDGVQQHFINVFDDGSIVLLWRGAGVVFAVFITAFDINIGKVAIVHIAQWLFQGIEMPLNSLAELIVLYQNGFYAQAGGKLDFIQGGNVGGVRHGDEQSIPPFIKG